MNGGKYKKAVKAVYYIAMVKFNNKNKLLISGNVIYEIIIVIILSLVSLKSSGFYFGINNNIFHIPYVLDLANYSEFINDEIYQSLKYFTSLVWPVLRLISNERNVYNVFYFSYIFIRFLTFFVILYLIKANGITKNVEIIICLCLLAVTPWLKQYSVIGLHGLFINFLSHTSLTWPFIFLAFLFLQRNDLIKTSFMIGIVFNINAFVGIWLAFLSITTIIYAQKTFRISTVIRSCLLFLLTAIPAGIWIGVTLYDTWTAEQINFIEYSRQYFPYHFLIESASLSNLCRLLTIFACGILSCKFIKDGKFWIGVQIGCFVLFVAGMLSPYLFNNKIVFNLHLLRSDGVEQFVAVILICIAATKLISQTVSAKNNALGILIVFFLVFPYRDGRTDISLLFVLFALVSAIIENNAMHYPARKDTVELGFEKILFSNKLLFFKNLITSDYFPLILMVSWYALSTIMNGFDPDYSRYALAISIMIGFIILYLIIALLHILSHEITRKIYLISLCAIFLISAIIGINNATDRKEKYNEDRAQWVEFTKMVRQSDLNGLFLFSYSNKSKYYKYISKYNSFQLLARRQVWADWKQGAAVMWYPKFYKQWVRRFNEIAMLHTSQEIRDYAIRNNIDYIVLNNNVHCPEYSSTVLNYGKYTVCEPRRKNENIYK